MVFLLECSTFFVVDCMFLVVVLTFLAEEHTFLFEERITFLGKDS